MEKEKEKTKTKNTTISWSRQRINFQKRRDQAGEHYN